MFIYSFAFALTLLSPNLQDAKTPQAASGTQRAMLTKAEFEATQKSVNDFYQKAFAGGTPDKPVTRSEVEAKVAEYIRTLLKDVQPQQIPDDQASDWAQLFSQAKMPTQAMALQTKALDYYSVRTMFTQAELMSNLIEEGKEDQVYEVARHCLNWNGSQVGMMGEIVNGAAVRKGLDKKKPALVIKWLNALADKIDITPSPDQRNGMGEYAYVDLKMKVLELQYRNNPSPALISEMKKLRARFANSKSSNAFGQGPAHRVDEFLAQATAMGTPAPELVFQKSIGEFQGIKSLKGKVVLLDFMAHWCGPCKAALPGIKKMQDQYGPQGLQVVSVTSFYGYYGAEQGVSKDKEFDLMHGFVKQFGMNWPVIFDTKQESHLKFHVGPIPHMVLIDRKGNIRHIQVGAGKQSEDETREVLKKVIAEK